MEEDHQLYEDVAEDMDAEVTGPQVTEDPAASTVGAVKPMETEYSGHFEWEIRNFAKQPDKQISETFEIGTYLWRMLCFPRQNSQPWRYISLFLEYPEAEYTPSNLSPKSSFKLIIKNHKDSSKDFFKGADHTFTADQVDWGFSQMLPLADVSTGSGYLREDGTLVIRVEITIQRDERYLYDSRAETGYVGLKNQGATCYMNSLLQYLYNVPYFRKAVYHMPVPENEEASKALPEALQSLFYKLQYARGAVSTKELTKSFGWNSYDAFQQHDVQELNRVLCEKLEEKMKNTKVERAINELFEGHTYNFIECIGVDYKSTRKESFMDLQLDVKGCKNVYESFDRYTEVEVLNGQNQYKTDDYGMQDARKGILFEDFPPVLQLQLKRFEYDCQRDAMVKINDRYEFYDELDLDREGGKYLSPNADRTASATRNTYKLHSVLVHSGGVHGGHYYGYIRPDGKTWLKFDDDRVSREDHRQALDAQFGGGDEDSYNAPGPAPNHGSYQVGALKYAKFSNAYMLVYVRLSDWPTIMGPVTKDDIVKHLLDRLEREMADKEARHRDKMEAHLYCSLKVATDQDFKEQVGKVNYFDLVDHAKLTADRCHYRLRKQTKFTEFKEEVARRTGIPVHRQRFWTWKWRSNGTYRPDRPLTAAEEQLQLVDLRAIRDLPREGAGHGRNAAQAKKSLMNIRLYLQELAEDGSSGGALFNSVAKTAGDVLLFFKMYDPFKETLTYHGHHIVPQASVAASVASMLLEEDDQDPKAPVELYEEVKFEPNVMVSPLDLRKNLKELEMDHGDVIIYQRAVPRPAEKGAEEEEEEGEAEGAEEGGAAAAEGPVVRYPTASAYLEYVHNRRQVHFKRLEEPAAAPAVSLELLRGATYDEVCAALAAALSLPDPTKLRLTRHNYFSCQPQRAPVKWRAMSSLEMLLTHGQHSTDILYFEVLDLPLEEMEQLKTVKVSYHNERGEFVGEQHSMRLRKEAPVSDLLAELASRLQQAAPAAAAAAATAAAAASSSRAASSGGAGAAAAAGVKVEGGGVKEEAVGTAGTGVAAAAVTAAGTGPTAAERAAERAAADAASLAAAAAMAAAGRPMRLLEIMQNKVYKIIEPTDTIDSLNDTYWHMRAEFVPEDQLASALGPKDVLLHVAHMAPPPLTGAAAAAWAAGPPPSVAGASGRGGEAMEADGEGSGEVGGDGDSDGVEEDEAAKAWELLKSQELTEQMPGLAFGDPFLIRVRERETMAQLRARLQALLGSPPEEFARWHVIFVGTRPNNAYLDDNQNLTVYFSEHKHQFAPPSSANAATGGSPTSATLVDPDKLTLAVLHEDRGGHGGAPRRQPPAAVSRYGYEKAVKIYG